MISKEYSQSIKNKIISDFVQKNARIPTSQEFFFLNKEAHEKYSGIDKTGYSSFDLDRPNYRDESSASMENLNRKTILEDMKILNQKINQLGIFVEDSFRGFKTSAAKHSNNLGLIEAKLNNLLLAKGDELFVNSIEENLSSMTNVNFTDSTADFVSGFCALKKTKRSKIASSDFILKSNIISNNTIVNKSISTKLERLAEEDGNFWDVAVYSKEKRGKVSLLLEVEFAAPRYVSELKLSLSNISVNSKSTISVAYSVNGIDFTFIEPYEEFINKPKYIKPIGIDAIRKVRILLSKTEYDTTSSNGLDNIYLFSLDHLAFYEDLYLENTEQTAIFGPYTNVDKLGNVVEFTKAAMTACVNNPENTYVEFYLSQDGSNWVSVDTQNKSSNIVTFGSIDTEINQSFIDSSLSINAILNKEDYLDDSDWMFSAYLNKCIDVDIAPVNRKSFIIKRNINLNNGWTYNKKNRLYETTVYVDNPIGQKINIGSTKVLVDNIEQTGNIHLKKGYHFIQTSTKNWKLVSNNILNSDTFKLEDSLYPYNHCYLFGGYSYSKNYSGDKIYLGFKDHFGYLMKYVSPEKFLLLEENDLEYYTIEQEGHLLKIKILVDKTNTNWNAEEVSFEWQSSLNASSQIYVKANLSTTDSKKTPIIEDFCIRTI